MTGGDGKHSLFKRLAWMLQCCSLIRSGCGMLVLQAGQRTALRLLVVGKSLTLLLLLNVADVRLSSWAFLKKAPPDTFQWACCEINIKKKTVMDWSGDPPGTSSCVMVSITLNIHQGPLVMSSFHVICVATLPLPDHDKCAQRRSWWRWAHARLPYLLTLLPDSSQPHHSPPEPGKLLLHLMFPVCVI